MCGANKSVVKHTTMTFIVGIKSGISLKFTQSIVKINLIIIVEYQITNNHEDNQCDNIWSTTTITIYRAQISCSYEVQTLHSVVEI